MDLSILRGFWYKRVHFLAYFDVLKGENRSYMLSSSNITLRLRPRLWAITCRNPSMGLTETAWYVFTIKKY